MELIAQNSVGSKSLRLVKGDLTERNVDAIVNAANSHLKHGGGVAGAIVRKGGSVIQEESDRIGYVPVGSAVITGAGRLPAHYVIHAVGPRIGEGDEDAKLKSALLSSFTIAAEKGLKSISLPAISSGVFGFPKDRCAAILVRGALHYFRENQGTSIEVIEFCIFDDETLAHFRKEFVKIRPSGDKF